MKKIDVFYLIALTAVVCNVIISVTAISNSVDKDDILNLNGIQDGDDERGKAAGGGSGVGKDAAVTESQEKRSFFKPDADRRGSFYPSGPAPHGNFGFSGYDRNPNYHSSGNGYSYGSPGAGGPSGGGGADYPPVVYGGSYPGPASYPGHSSGGGGGGYGLSHGHPQQHGHMLKSLLIPIAGVALLGAAAVLAKSHPLLLQLGVLSGKRRRRDLDSLVMPRVGYPQNPHVQPAHPNMKM